jgi:hypothetical protein
MKCSSLYISSCDEPDYLGRSRKETKKENFNFHKMDLFILDYLINLVIMVGREAKK